MPDSWCRGVVSLGGDVGKEAERLKFWLNLEETQKQEHLVLTIKS